MTDKETPIQMPPGFDPKMIGAAIEEVKGMGKAAKQEEFAILAELVTELKTQSLLLKQIHTLAYKIAIKYGAIEEPPQKK